ncbi:hypothetical protein VTO73DRAFT_12656 [Trametes versicolor]
MLARPPVQLGILHDITRPTDYTTTTSAAAPPSRFTTTTPNLRLRVVTRPLRAPRLPHHLFFSTPFCAR